MTISHSGFSFPGVAEEVKFGEWKRTPQYTSAFGVAGESLIDSKRVSREFEVRVYLYGGFDSSAAVYTFLGAADARTGNAGVFVDDGLQAKTLRNVEFSSLQLEEGPLSTAPDGGWIAIVMLKFKQLSP